MSLAAYRVGRAIVVGRSCGFCWEVKAWDLYRAGKRRFGLAWGGEEQVLGTQGVGKRTFGVCKELGRGGSGMQSVGKTGVVFCKAWGREGLCCEQLYLLFCVSPKSPNSEFELISLDCVSFD